MPARATSDPIRDHEARVASAVRERDRAWRRALGVHPGDGPETPEELRTQYEVMLRKLSRAERDLARRVVNGYPGV